MSEKLDVVFATWAIGHSYRRRVKEFIKYNSKTKSCHAAKYLIFTDNVSAFDEIRNGSDNIIDVVNIFDFIESHQIELARNEYIPRCESEEEFSKDWIKNKTLFSYPAKRFLFLKLYELGITKFFYIDADVLVNRQLTNEELYDRFNTEPNSVVLLGMHPVSVLWDWHVPADVNPWFKVQAPPMMRENQTIDVYRILYLILYEVKKIVKEKYNHDVHLLDYTHYQTVYLAEGIFRYYHFADKEELLKYYHVFDEAMKFVYEEPLIRNAMEGPGWMLPDFIPHMVANILCNLKLYDMPNGGVFEGQIFWEDRHMLPNCCDLIPTDTVEQFVIQNKDILNNEYVYKRQPQFGHANALHEFNVYEAKDIWVYDEETDSYKLVPRIEE